jgi:hypothetical protein
MICATLELNNFHVWRAFMMILIDNLFANEVVEFSL